jgi:predicted nucleotidyltransferase
MQKLWQKRPKLAYSKDVLDIVQFGSSAEEGKNPNDLDIAVIFNKIPLKEQLNQAQEIKKQLETASEIPIHINSFDLYSLFDNSNFA